MKFIKVITLTLIGFSSQAISTAASAPIDQFDEEQSQEGRFLRGQTMTMADHFVASASLKTHNNNMDMANPDNCPAPSRRQVIGNQCLGPNQVPTVCCGRNKIRSYVACMPRNLPTCFTGGRGSGRGIGYEYAYDYEQEELPTTNYYQESQSGQPTMSMANPDNCPAPSRRQVMGNQCLGPNQVPTVCCGRNKMRSYVACMPRNLPTCFTGGRGSQNFATRTTTLSALPHSVEQDSEDYGGRSGGYGGYGR